MPVEMADGDIYWSLLGSCLDQMGFLVPVLDAGKGNALSEGVHNKADESIGSFLCEGYAEED